MQFLVLILAFVGTLAMGFVFSIIGALPAGLLVELAWNNVVPAALNGPHLTYIQSVCLVLVAWVLIKPTLSSEGKKG
jgi:hypothetical protein